MYGSSNPGVLESEAPKQPSDQGFILTPGSGVSWSWLESEQKSAEWRPHTYENMTTTVFDPTLHPRHLTGTFAPKIMSAPEVTVEADDDLESCRSFGDASTLVTATDLTAIGLILGGGFPGPKTI